MAAKKANGTNGSNRAARAVPAGWVQGMAVVGLIVGLVLLLMAAHNRMMIGHIDDDQAAIKAALSRHGGPWSEMGDAVLEQRERSKAMMDSMAEMQSNLRDLHQRLDQIILKHADLKVEIEPVPPAKPRE